MQTTLGAEFQNDTGAIITSLAVSYHCEQWRLGTAGRVDRMDFQVSTDATSLTTGSWIDVDSLDCSRRSSDGVTGVEPALWRCVIGLDATHSQLT